MPMEYGVLYTLLALPDKTPFEVGRLFLGIYGDLAKRTMLRCILCDAQMIEAGLELVGTTDVGPFHDCQFMWRLRIIECGRQEMLHVLHLLEFLLTSNRYHSFSFILIP